MSDYLSVVKIEENNNILKQITSGYFNQEVLIDNNFLIDLLYYQKQDTLKENTLIKELAERNINSNANNMQKKESLIVISENENNFDELLKLLKLKKEKLPLLNIYYIKKDFLNENIKIIRNELNSFHNENLILKDDFFKEDIPIEYLEYFINIQQTKSSKYGKMKCLFTHIEDFSGYNENILIKKEKRLLVLKKEFDSIIDVRDLSLNLIRLLDVEKKMDKEKFKKNKKELDFIFDITKERETEKEVSFFLYSPYLNRKNIKKIKEYLN